MNLIFNIVSGVLILAVAIIAYKYLETFWTYKLYKPYKWENAVKNKLVSESLKTLEHSYYDKIRFFSMWFQIERLKRENIQGDFAELGVHKGETAKIIHAMDPARKLHLFDTFEGFKEADLKHENKQGGEYSTTNFSDTDLETVKKYVDGGEKAIYYPGYFPSTAKGLDNTTFAFVYLDADLYLPTIEGLKFFYPKLSAGGVIMVHDYNHTWEGIKKALDEFMPTIPESLIELPDWKGSVMIVKNSGKSA
ncbi:MAG TPA: TylF/MycF/NovP-related O-methyltransferase [Bacteroidia bacterium]|jgi:O-methyltransferase